MELWHYLNLGVALATFVLSLVLTRHTCRRDEVNDLRQQLSEVQRELEKCEQDRKDYYQEKITLFQRLFEKTAEDTKR